MQLEIPVTGLSGLGKKVVVLARELYCIHNLLIAFLILVSHIPLFILVSELVLFFLFGHISSVNLVACHLRDIRLFQELVAQVDL